MPKHGHVTPSNFAKVMTMAHYRAILKNPDKLYEFSATAEKYAISVCRGFLGVEDREITARALEHGKTYEPMARAMYENENFTTVPEIAEPIYHPRFKFVCGIPDGLIGCNGILEIKCPESADNHFLNISEGLQIEDYYAQMQGYMWITGRKWCDFVSFHPHYPENLMLHTQNVDRDDSYIEILEKKITAFFELILTKMRTVSPEHATYMKNAYM